MGRRLLRVAAAVFLLTVLLNVLAWNSEAFCDLYVEYVFPLWGPLYGVFTGLTRLSVGEFMIALGVMLLGLTAVFSLSAFIFMIIKKGTCFRIFYGRFMTVMALVLTLVFAVETLNCFILYHCSTFEDKYLSAYLKGEREYTVEELITLRDMVVKEANKLAHEMERDDHGHVVYNGDMGAEAIISMQRLGLYYPQLSGYYSRPKAMLSSDFLSQQYMQGYYFPFSMEANYNDVMYIANKPFTMCHELAHTKGFIYEDEANLIGYLACVNSDDPFFKYSGYLSVINYIERDYKESIGYDEEIYAKHAKLSYLVKKDNVFLTPESWEKVEEKAVLDTQTVKKASNSFTDATLKANGIESGMASYSKVVGLMMDYYWSQDRGLAEN